MKRVALLALLFLLIGAVINIAVAWSFELPVVPDYWNAPGSSLNFARIFPDGFTSQRQPGILDVWFVRNRSEPSREYAALKPEAAPPGWGRSPPGAYAPADKDEYSVWSRSTGWPMPGMVRHTLWSNGVEYPLGVIDNGATVTPATLGMRARVLPLQPRWPGFVVNTLLFGACAAVLACPLRLRGWLRSRRNLCARCAYPLGGFTVCPECGTQRRAAARPGAGVAA